MSSRTRVDKCREVSPTEQALQPAHKKLVNYTRTESTRDRVFHIKHITYFKRWRTQLNICYYSNAQESGEPFAAWQQKKG